MPTIDMAFTAPRMLDSGEIAITPANRALAMRICLQAEEGKVYNAAIGPQRRKRSLDANAYFWVLVGKLAEATGIGKAEIYRNAIKDIGGNSELVCAQDAAADRLCETWQQRGEGWLTTTSPSKLEGCTNVTLYYGSSAYDTRQMARLIDHVVQDCRACGIETMTPAELSLLVEDWGKHGNK